MPIIEAGQGNNRNVRNFQFVRAIGALVEVGDKDHQKIVSAAINTAAEAAGYKKTDGYTPEVAKAITDALRQDLPGVVIVRELQGKFGGTQMVVGAEAEKPFNGNYARIAIDDDGVRYVASFSVAAEGGAVGNRVVTGLAASVKGMEALGLGKGSPVAFTAFASADKDEHGAERKNEQGKPYWGFSSMIKTPGPDGSFGRDSGESVVPTKGLWPDLKALREEKKAGFEKLGVTGRDLTQAVRKEETKALIADFYKPVLQAHDMWARHAASSEAQSGPAAGGSDEAPEAAASVPHSASTVDGFDMDDDIPF